MAVNDSTMGMALILSNTCKSTKIQAYPTDGHRFVSWNDGNTDNPRTITVIEDAIYIASFAEDVSIDAANELDALTFYPNPTSGTITFNHADIRKVEVMDVMGRMVATFENSNIIDLSKLSKGWRMQFAPTIIVYIFVGAYRIRPTHLTLNILYQTKKYLFLQTVIKR